MHAHAHACSHRDDKDLLSLLKIHANTANFSIKLSTLCLINKSNLCAYGYNLLVYERDARGCKFATGCKICTREQICTRVQISHMNTVSKRTNVPVQAHLTSVPMISIRQRSREPFIPSFTHFIKFIDQFLGHRQ